MEVTEVDAMDTATHAPLILSNDEYALLLEILEREQAKLLVGIRHTDNRHFREELKRRQELMIQLFQRLSKD
jgi:hypothetical protein